MLLKEIVKPGEKPRVSPTNLSRNTQLIIAFGANTYVLSKELTKLFRAGTIGFADLGNYEVREVKVVDKETNKETTILSLGLTGELQTVEDFTGFTDSPTTATLTTADVKAKMAVEFKAITTL